MGGSKVKYEAPVIPKDDTFEKFLQYQQQQQANADKRAADERTAAAEAEKQRLATSQAGMYDFAINTQNQLRQGLINYNEGVTQLRDRAAQAGYGGDDAVNALTRLYSDEILPGRRTTGIGAAYEEILGREATAEEQAKATERFNQGYYTSNEDLRNSLYKGSEYTSKFNNNYLDNYYDTMYGKQTTDAAGLKTGQRTYNFSSNLLPQLAGDTTKRAGITLPQFGSFTGTAAEIEDQQQNVRDTRQFLYGAGLTNLQGEIDKETQKLKTEGSKEIAKVQSQGALYSGLVGSFNF